MSKGPARRYSWPPAEPGNDLAVKHGAFSEAKLKPRSEEIATELRELVPMGNPSEAPSIWILAGILARIERARDWLDTQEHGIFRNGEGEPSTTSSRRTCHC